MEIYSIFLIFPNIDFNAPNIPHYVFNTAFHELEIRLNRELVGGENLAINFL